MEKLNKRGLGLWITGSIKGRGESFRLNQNESSLLPFFPELQRSALYSLIGDWKILCWRSIMAEEKRHVDAAIWDSSNKKLEEKMPKDLVLQPGPKKEPGPVQRP